MSEGTEVFDDDTGNAIGKVVKDSRARRRYNIKTDGTYVKAIMPERYTLTLTIDGKVLKMIMFFCRWKEINKKDQR